MSNDIPLKHYVYTLAYPEDYPDSQKAGIVFYVGKGTKRKDKRGERIDEHEREARQGKNSHKHNIIRKIWANNRQVAKTKLAFFKAHEEACIYEIASIFLMRGCGHLVNITDGGDGMLGSTHNKGRKHSEETRRKIGEAGKGRPGSMKGKHHTAEARQKLSLAGKGRTPHNKGKPGPPAWNKGIPASEESKAILRKYSDARKGVSIVFSEEHKRNLRISRAKQVMRKGYTRPPEVVKKVADANRGKKRSPSEKTLAHLRRLNESRRGKPRQMSESWHRNIAESNKRMKTGIPRGEEAKRKTAETWKKKAMDRLNAQISQSGELRQYQQLRLIAEDTDMSFQDLNVQENL